MPDFTDFSKKQIEWSLKDAWNDDFEKYKTLKEPRLASRENFPFAYPGPYSINIGGTTKKKMRRGFMRSIIMDTMTASNAGIKNPGYYRLNFQFNPEYIERNVQMSIGAVNPLLQNPANLTQAVPGTAVFNFTMLFNREAEVAQWDMVNEIDAIRRSELINNAGLLSKVAEDLLSGPGELGVMHDLGIFDRIIGQGISNELIDIITKYSEAHLQKVKDKQIEEGKEDFLPPFKEDAFRQSVNKNIGNFAFLNPMPVRIVFSDLFMVEGLVVGSAVAFQKFSENMVPTICQVNCNVQALYVGFAKKNAYLTDSLTSWATGLRVESEEENKKVQAAQNNLRNSLKEVYVAINNDGRVSNQNYSAGAVAVERLQVPDYNADGMKVFFKLLPATTFYSGNISQDAYRYVTLPQWYNAFAAGSAQLGIMVDNSGAFKGIDVQKQFGGINKPLPITLYLRTSDKDFNNVSSTISVKIMDTGKRPNLPTAVPSKNPLKQLSATPATDGKWVKLGKDENGLEKETKTATGKILYTFKNTFTIFPDAVADKHETIDATSKCQLQISITFTKMIGDIPASYKPNEMTLIYNDVNSLPFFYDKSAYQSSNLALKNKRMLFITTGSIITDRR